MRAAAALVVVLAIARAASAQTMPGALAIDHDKITACDDCHHEIAKSPDVDDGKCKKCHASATKGFHATAKFVGSKRCASCHKEHQGERYDLMGWSSVQGGRDHFDHVLTGWPLDGQHRLEKCLDCHRTKDRQGLVTFTHATRACDSCHEKDQPHKVVKAALLRCDRCHTTSAWKPYTLQAFDHDQRDQAAMPLLGSHKDVACTKCHPRAVFKLPFPRPDACGNAGCHTSPHDGHLFALERCELCHSPTFRTLKEQRFDHAGEAHFALGPAHDRLACYRCHTKALAAIVPGPACEGCHAQQSHHGARFKQFGTPPRCGTCHQETATWDPIRFDHGANTKFPLGYKHADATCRACHAGRGPTEFQQVGTGCMDCHTHRNAHDRQYKDHQCTQAGCHLHVGDLHTANTVPKGSPQEAAHAITGTFPLVKRHKLDERGRPVPCGACHNGRTQQGKTSFVHVSTGCSDNACHEDSLHRGSLDRRGAAICTTCHTSGTWVAGTFDHQVDPFPTGEPGFALRGAHQDNTCEACHPKRQFAGTPRTCAAEGCHAADDAHKGRLGKQCERCHVETGDNLFDHQSMSAFRLDGKHLAVRCVDCHPSKTFKPRPVDCFGCHPEPAVHQGQYGTGCAQCHSTRTWVDIVPLHDVGDFSLKGAHDNIACERCHRDSRPLAGSGNLCLNCHRQDDVHSNSLSPRCGECHTQWSFAPARFDHNRVGCTLTGLHRTIACVDCHRSGNFAGLSPTCVSCHHDDAQRAAAVPTDPQLATSTNHPIQPQCASCHNPNTWVGAPAARFGRDSVCR